MIKLIKGRLRWKDEDLVGMSHVLGAEASKKQAPVTDSILKAAVKRGVIISEKLQRVLEKSMVERSLIQEAISRPHLDRLTPSYNPERLERCYPHQLIALMFMSFRNAYLLADSPGVGKTPVAILWAEKRMQDRVLVICPNTAKAQWRREIRRWRSHKRKITIVEGTIETQNELAQRSGWVIAHPEALVHAWEGLTAESWDVVIFDEAHAIRNHEAQRSQTAFMLEATFKLAMTGHPYFKAPDELYSILHFLYPNTYTSYWRFFSMHVLAIPKYFGGFDIKGVRSRKLLRWEIEPFALRRTKRQVFKDLPAISRIPRYVEMPKAYKKEYDGLKTQFFAKLETADERGERILAIPSVLARVTRMRQYIVDPQLLRAKKNSLKYPVVVELMEELDGPPVIFTSFRQAAVALSKYLMKKGFKTGMIHGNMKARDLDRVQRRFLAGKLDATIVVTQAGGTALNLGKYGYLIFLDLPWTWADMEQAEGRVDRPEEGTGKMVPTTAFRIIVKGTYEERMERLIDERKEKFDQVFEKYNRRQLKAFFN